MSIYGGPDIITDNLIMHLDAANTKSYSGSGTSWFDLSGNNNHGTLLYGPTFNSSNYGNISFSSASSNIVAVNLNTTVRINNTTSSSSLYQWTIMLYYKSNNILTDINATSPRHTLFAFNDATFFGNGYDYLDLELWNDEYVFFNGNGSTNQGAMQANSRGSNNTGKFNLVTMTVSGNTISVYHNNIATARSSRASTLSMSSAYFMLASRGVSNRLDGSVAAVYLYNAVLSGNQIIQNYNAIKGRFIL